LAIQNGGANKQDDKCHIVMMELRQP